MVMIDYEKEKEKLIREGKQYMYQRRYSDWEDFVHNNGSHWGGVLLDVLKELDAGVKYEQVLERIGKYCDSAHYSDWIRDSAFVFSPKGPEFFYYLRDNKLLFSFWGEKNWEDFIKEIEEENKHPVFTEEEQVLYDLQKRIYRAEERIENISKEKEKMKLQIKEMDKEEDDLKVLLKQLSAQEDELKQGDNKKNTKKETTKKESKKLDAPTL